MEATWGVGTLTELREPERVTRTLPEASGQAWSQAHREPPGATEFVLALGSVVAVVRPLCPPSSASSSAQPGLGGGAMDRAPFFSTFLSVAFLISVLPQGQNYLTQKPWLL